MEKRTKQKSYARDQRIKKLYCTFLALCRKDLSVLSRDSLKEVKTFKMWVIFLKHAQREKIYIYFFK